jgi:thioesterase domain-containing protein
VRELRDLGERLKQERITRGESIEHWHDWVTNIIPSPWESAEHFEIMTEE